MNSQGNKELIGIISGIGLGRLAVSLGRNRLALRHPLLAKLCEDLTKMRTVHPVRAIYSVPTIVVAMVSRAPGGRWNSA
jgi:hypothetical protein